MSRKKIIRMYLAAAAVSVIIFIASLGASFRSQPVQLSSIPDDSESENESSEPVSTSIENAGYMLGEYEGSLALYRAGSEKPYRKLDYSISMLTDFDRELISRGIYVDTEKELNKLIEDFVS